MSLFPLARSSQTYQTLRVAVQNRQSADVRYKGHIRKVCPHTLGLKNGREKVLTYQYGGGSSSGLPPGGEWRCMFVEDIESITLTDDGWHTDHNHSQPQTCVDVIDIETG